MLNIIVKKRDVSFISEAEGKVMTLLLFIQIFTNLFKLKLMISLLFFTSTLNFIS